MILTEAWPKYEQDKKYLNYSPATLKARFPFYPERGEL